MSNGNEPASRTKALVLGGGGPVGVGWQLGLAAGLASGGVHLGAADFVVGTSAGSITGSMLKGGADPSQLVDDVAALFAQGVAGSGADQLPAAGLAGIMEQLMGAVSGADDPEANAARLAEVGRFALAADTIHEDAFVGTLGSALGTQPWPSSFACTAVNARTGEFVVWDETKAVPLERAVASSCSVPGIYPPVTIDGERYMDGGVRSPLNADLAAGYDSVVVVSVMVMELPPMFDDPRIAAFFDAQRAEIDGLREAGTRVEVIVPDAEFLALSGFGMALMDFSLVAAAADAGMRLGKLEADRVAAIWGS